jgi:hypothetical protein
MEYGRKDAVDVVAGKMSEHIKELKAMKVNLSKHFLLKKVTFMLVIIIIHFA